jgi:hypothetical protein
MSVQLLPNNLDDNSLADQISHSEVTALGTE